MSEHKHNWRKVMVSNPITDPRQYALKGQEVFVGRVCIRCNEDEHRRPGPPWQVCHMCGSDMTDCGQKDVLTHLFECSRTGCGHKYRKREYDPIVLEELTVASKEAEVVA